MKRDELLEYMEKFDLDIKSEKTLTNGSLFQLEDCPFSDEHSDRSYIILLDNGAVVANCHHTSCNEWASWTELRKIKEGADYKEPKKKSSSADDKFTRMNNVLNQHVWLFQDEYGIPYASIRKDINSDVKITCPVQSSEFKLYYKNLHYQLSNFVVMKNEMETVEAHYSMLARTGQRKPLFYRIFNNDYKTVHYHLSDDDGTSVLMKDGKAEIVQTPDMIFKQTKSFRSQITPDLTAKPADLFLYVKKHFNLETDDDVLLVTLYLLTGFLGVRLNHPIFMVYGEKGAAKSSMLRRVQSILDPKNMDLCTLPRNIDSLCIRLSNSYLTCLDNLSYIKSDISNTLCNSVTGGIYSKRALYQNTEEITVSIKSMVAISGLSVITSASDLLDRIVAIKLKKLGENKLKTEEELDKEFQADLPKILGCCFNAVAQALHQSYQIKTSYKTRLADFSTWCIRMGIVLGVPEDDTVHVLKRNQSRINRLSIEENIVAQVLMIFMEHRQEYISSVSVLFKKLKEVASDMNISLVNFPKQPNQLSRRINEVRSNLLEYGITYDIKNVGQHRQISIENKNSKPEVKLKI